MKNVTLIASLVLFAAVLGVYAQDFADNTSNNLFFKKERESTTLIGFKAVYFEGKTYLNWKVKNEKQDDLFIIFRSFDNDNFEIIDIKQGVGTPIEAPIFYSYIDQKPLTGISYYKILKVYADRSYYQSSVIMVTAGEVSMLNDQSFFKWNSVH